MTHKFKVGDLVKCVAWTAGDNKMRSHDARLQLGAVYKVVQVVALANQDCLYLYRTDGKSIFWFASRFILFDGWTNDDAQPKFEVKINLL